MRIKRFTNREMKHAFMRMLAMQSVSALCHMATREGNINRVIDPTDARQPTLLTMCVLYGWTEGALALLERGANPNPPSQREGLLMMLCQSTHDDERARPMLEALLRHGAVITGDDGCLVEQALRNHMSWVPDLIQAGASLPYRSGYDWARGAVHQCHKMGGDPTCAWRALDSMAGTGADVQQAQSVMGCSVANYLRNGFLHVAPAAAEVLSWWEHWVLRQGMSTELPNFTSQKTKVRL